MASIEHGLRRILLWLLAASVAGTGADLLFQGHYEEWTQAIPLVLLGMTSIAIAWQVSAPSRPSTRALQGSLVLLIAGGLLGVVLHFQSSAEFQLEMDPSMPVSMLLWKALQATAPPALAPATMAQVGLLGLAYTYRHPALGGQMPHGGLEPADAGGHKP